MSQAEAQDAQLLEDAIAYYHALLANSRRLSEDSMQMLGEQMPPRRLTFGGRPLCNVLRPHFFTRAQFDYVSQTCTALTNAMAKLGRVMLGEDKAESERLITALGLTDEELRLLAYDTGYQAISAHSRLDSFLSSDGTLQFVEYNAESPAGASYEDGLADLFSELPIMQEFSQRFTVSRFQVKEKLLAMLLKNYREYLGTRPAKVPNIAIVDWPDVPTQSEFQLLQEYFEAHGVPTIICDPRELEYRANQLYRGDFPVDLLFKRVLGSELLQRADEVRPIIQAYEAGTVCMINSFRCKLFHKKMIFGLLTDEANARYFSSAEREFIARHIPWTRRVQAGSTTYQGQSVDLAEFIRQNRERLVLKPNDEYGGKGITIGWETDLAAWQQAYEGALTSPYVVQEKVMVAKEPFPVMQDGMIIFAERAVDCDPYIFDGEVAGALTRLSAAALLNVTAGTGSVVPTFIIEGRGEGKVRPADSEGCV